LKKKEKQKKRGGIEYHKHKGSPALDLIQSTEQGFLLLHSSTSTLKTRTKKKGRRSFERSFTNNTQQRNKERNEEKKKSQQKITVN
jgi:hypothetical protein